MIAGTGAMRLAMEAGLASGMGWRAMACAVALMGLLAPREAGALPAGPEGAAFYVPPSPLPDGGAGTPIWSRALSGTMALPSAARNELLLYLSVDPNGKTVPVSGTLSIPKGTAPEGGWPVIVWTHGTTGLSPVCAPSLDTETGPEHGYIKVIQPLLDRFISDGFAVVATDYQGLGVAVGFHPFLIGAPNGKNALDMLRAARAIEPGIGKRYAVVGHSQGGQADLFTAAEGPAYLPDYTLVGNIAMAPGSHIKARLETIMASDQTELALPYVLYAMRSYAAYDPAIDLSGILTDTTIANLPELDEQCMSYALTKTSFATAIAKDAFLAAPKLDAFLAKAKDNEPGLLAIGVPTVIMQGDADVTVRPVDTDAVAAELCEGGTLLDYRTYPGADHQGVMKDGADDAATWLKARFAGEKAASNCDALPKAAK